MESKTSAEEQKESQSQSHPTGKGTTAGLRRQPTKYPHGLGISIHMTTDSDKDQIQTQDYSRASTLRSNWDHSLCSSDYQPDDEEVSYPHRYSISMIGHKANLAELQVRRYKYPLTGNYYLDTPEALNKSKHQQLMEFGRLYCQWKYLRWPLTFIASVLLFFGLITYCIWLHDVSVERERYLQRQFHYASTPINSEEEGFMSATEQAHSPMPESQPTPMINGNTTPRSHRLQESTILRAIGTRHRQQPKEQKLTTLDYNASKSRPAWDKDRKGDKQSQSQTPPPQQQDADSATTLPTPEAAAAALVPIRFTSGHQNSFGVPIEEDERLLRLLNGLLPLPPTIQPSVHSLPKVSPTIPPITTRLRPTSAMNEQPAQASLGRTPSQPQMESGCYSTALPMCRGVLDYDLTHNPSRSLSAVEERDFQQLINSNCSARAAEFLCAALEPECRPLHIGALPPCRRICKAIFEACSLAIANSDTLSEIFDCHQYPDVDADEERCEDPTRRRGYCFDNEFECNDRSCIPRQWQCDNIKDCAFGEDEEGCLVCEQPDEFRCRSNEKCVSDALRCDSNYDCFDGSDEENCEESDDYAAGSGDSDSDDEEGTASAAAFDEAALNRFPRIFSYASFLSPNQTSSRPDHLYTYITAALDAENGTRTHFQVHEITNRTGGISTEEVTNGVPEEGPRGFVNFRDSKEIMMTSDSENKFKYSAARTNRSSSRFVPPAITPLEVMTTPERDAISSTAASERHSTATCAPHQLRCISGKCITVEQLCDKKIDCADGADELMCVYKTRATTTTGGEATTALPSLTTPTMMHRPSTRLARTTTTTPTPTSTAPLSMRRTSRT